MTVHNAKGLEFPVVFMTGMEEDIFPHKLSINTEHGIEEERRLCYVGLTRAMDRVYLTCAELRRTFNGMAEYRRPSRFLEEIPEQLILKRIYKTHFQDTYSDNQRYYKIEKSGNENYRSTIIDHQLKRDFFKEENRTGNESKFSVKDQVIHPRYGVGRISRIEGSGDNIKLTISFGRSNKVFMEKYTPLEKLN